MNQTPILTFQERGGITVGHIEAASVLDAVNVSHVGEALMTYVEKHPRANLLLDFEHVDYLSSAVLTELLRLHKFLMDQGGHLRLCSLNDDIRKVFEITNLDKLFMIYEDADAGVVKFKRSLAVEAQDRAWEPGV